MQEVIKRWTFVGTMRETKVYERSPRNQANETIRQRIYRHSILGRKCKFCQKEDKDVAFHVADECASCERARGRFGICPLCNFPHSQNARRSDGKGRKPVCRAQPDIPSGGPDRPNIEYHRKRVEREITSLPLAEWTEHYEWQAGYATAAYSLSAAGTATPPADSSTLQTSSSMEGP